jgi:ubiquinol-cytochrome c reductase cytochrome b subunit
VTQFAQGTDERLQASTPLRRLLNKVFPDHWSFMLGEIALYSFILLLITGTLLALFFKPSDTVVIYHGSYRPLSGVPMTDAYSSTLDLSFDVRGGLLLRQMHHWAANLFMAAIVIHMLRIFFTGVFRNPRELNWVIGLTLFWLGLAEGFAGYSLPDDGLSGTGLRIAYSIALGIPVIGTWLAASLFGGEFPGSLIIPRLYILHVFLVPGLLVALITVHLLLIVTQKHTQWPRPGHTSANVVGTRMVPKFALSSTGLALFVFAVIAFLGGLIQINPVWQWGPYEASAVTSNAQPDWYVWFLEGSLRLFPPVTLHLGPYTIPTQFWGGVLIPTILAILAYIYPWLERRFTGDRGPHQLTQRPRDVPRRTAVGAMALTFWLVLSAAAADDTIALTFHANLDAIVWIGRAALIVLPPLAYLAAHRLALNLQRHDRHTLEHGIETGTITRDADGKYVEVHQPLGQEVAYTGWAVPKRPNRVLTERLVRRNMGFFRPVPNNTIAPDGGREAQPQPPATRSRRAVR